MEILRRSIWWVNLIIDDFYKDLIYKYAQYVGIGIKSKSKGLYITHSKFAECYTEDEVFDCLEGVRKQAKRLIRELTGYIVLMSGKSVDIAIGNLEHHLNGNVIVCSVVKTDITIKSKSISYQIVNGIKVNVDGIDHKVLITEDPDIREILILFTDPNYVNLYKIIEILKLKLGGEKKLIKAGLISSSKLKRIKQNLNNPQLSGKQARHYKFHGNVADKAKMSRTELINGVRALVIEFL